MQHTLHCFRNLYPFRSIFFKRERIFGPNFWRSKTPVMCSSTSYSTGITDPNITVNPQDCLIDDRLSIRIQGLEASQAVTLFNQTSSDKGLKFSSYGCYKANQKGKVDIAEDECLQGTYSGKDAMGLFWSLQPAPGFEMKRLMKTNISTPLTSTLSVYSGFLTWEELHKGDNVALVSSEVRRWYKSSNVKREVIRDGRLRGVLFIPEGSGPFPALIDMFGVIGGLVEIRAALLASRGFMALALAYFDYEDLPTNFSDVCNEYFEEAVEWLSSHYLTLPGGIGAVGLSFGGIYSNFMATFMKEVVAAVVINAPPYCPPETALQDGESVARRIVDVEKLQESPEGLIMRWCYNHYDEFIIKSWESDARFLSIVSGDDQCLDPSYMEYWYDKCPPEHKHKIEFIKYPDAGHLVEPPYSPLHRVTAIRIPFKGICVWGGKLEGHARAQEDSWIRILRFLKENVPRKPELLEDRTKTSESSNQDPEVLKSTAEKLSTSYAQQRKSKL